MVTELTIANDALTEMGQSALLSLTDVQYRAATRTVMDNNIQRALDLVIPLHPWACTLEDTRLVPLDETPIVGRSYTHPLPPDFGRLWCFTDESKRVYRDGWDIRGNRIHSNYEVMYIHYSRRVLRTDCSSLRDYVADAISAWLVWRTCRSFGLTQKDQNDKHAAYLSRLRLAKSLNQTENPHIEWYTTAWQDSMRATGPL